MSGTPTIAERRRAAVVLCSQNLPVPQDRRVWREALTLAGAGHRVTVVCPGDRSQPRRETASGVRVLRYPMPPGLPGLAGQVLETAWALVCVAAVAGWLRARRRIEVLHAANPPDSFFLVAWLLRPLGVRFVYDQHDLCPELLSARAPEAPHVLAWFLRRLELGSYRRADLVITPNNAYRRLALGRGGCIPEQVVTVRSGPDEVVPREASGGSGPLVVAFAGVINEQDNVELLLRAGPARGTPAPWPSWTGG
jgi:glycosyltransferase involved in cell wall biosynthesis